MTSKADGRVHPKLRMFADCDPTINAQRAELSPVLSVPDLAQSAPSIRGLMSTPLTPHATREAPKPTKDSRPDTRTRVNVFVDLHRPDVAPLPGERRRNGRLVLAEVAVA